MKLIIEIDMDSAAFAPDPNYEVWRILFDFSSRLRAATPLNRLGVLEGLRDANDNRVGVAKIVEE